MVHKNHDPQKLGPKSLGTIRPVTPEILLIWTNVARTNVEWTNATVPVGSLNQVGLVSVCGKYQFSSMPRSSLKVCGVGLGWVVGWW